MKFLPHPVLSAPYQTPNTLQSTSLSALAGAVVAVATAHGGAQVSGQDAALGWQVREGAGVSQEKSEPEPEPGASGEEMGKARLRGWGSREGA